MTFTTGYAMSWNPVRSRCTRRRRRWGKSKMRRDTRQLAASPFDVLVIGAGIYGACVANEAVQRGLSVALIDKTDFGGATSANSLKTIHGGLRYLQQADLTRMRDSIRERRALLRIAAHLVHP